MNGRISSLPGVSVDRLVGLVGLLLFLHWLEC